jgi:hypothetical protein
MAGYINQKPYFAIQNKTFSSQLLLQLFAHIVNCRPFVTCKSYPNRTLNPRAYGIDEFVPFYEKNKSTKE